ncbi:MAG: WbqC family protein [Muribaculaceae bacterium]|nr:WbqC family protein [Muribaculaceae bacterium]
MNWCPGSFDYDIGWWAAALAAGSVVINTDERRLSLRHGHHRYSVCGPNGVQQLTIPLVASTRTMDTPMSDVLISEHAHWRRVHWGALYSAYGRTPYFDYVAPALEPIINGRQTHLLDFNRQMQQLITDFMQLPIAFDYRPLCSQATEQINLSPVHYYQVWESKHGFMPGLSILDLMMNEGPEGIFTLMRMCASQ